ncbi:MAG: hypothetical protein CMP51_01995 [Flavobacteriales bacterium]|nr:hypothetical protein [Flavobacteriales bacterium]|tara:strand:- start:3373 stop:4812 length:1440 start_codon:yes stop_codon:yes gene_type:complete
MSKFYLNIICAILPFFLASQEKVNFKRLSNNINSNDTEINFIQIDENTALYTSTFNEKNDKGINEQKSAIFKSIRKNEEWLKGSYFDLQINQSVANISPSHDINIMYISICKQLNNCKIARVNINNYSFEYLNENINQEGCRNTQPHYTTHNNQRVLYFSSNRKGGMGGFDIWFSIIDEKGNFGAPINAGVRVNSEYDEVTPFYNLFSEKLFYSSNSNGQKSGFDIYNIDGALNKWGYKEEVEWMNSKQDDLYPFFIKKNEGFLSSNRPLSLTKDSMICCNDIFYFHFPEDTTTIKKPDSSIPFDPIILYFHNDEPDPKSLKKHTNTDYLSSYISYFQKKDLYLKINPSNEISAFFNFTLKNNFNKLNDLLNKILIALENEEKIELYVKGYASPLSSDSYNSILSKRRINNLINYISNFNNGKFVVFLQNKNLKIIEVSYGESMAKINTSDDPSAVKKSIYSIEAMNERKIEIINLISK